MLKAVLLDLDNTLILFNEPAFYDRFFDEMAVFFHDLMARELLIENTIAATMALKENNGALLNRDCFTRAFNAGGDLPMERFWERWLAFYENVYSPFGVSVTVPRDQEYTLDRLTRSGLTLVVASNPVFPPIALKRRMAWGGIDPARFSLLTHMDNMSFVKPREGYFLSICKMIGTVPEACLMVGNDPVNDMAAATAGMKTYLTTDASEIHFASLTGGDASRGAHFHDFQGPFSGVWETVAGLLG